MTLFIILAALMAFVTAGAVFAPLIWSGAREESRAARDAAVYRDQLAELERDVERGTLSATQAAGTRAEIARRLLAASAKAERADSLGPAPRETSRMFARIGLASLPVAGVAVYLGIGSPGLPDTPFAARPAAEQRAGLAHLPGQQTRPSQAEAVAELARRGEAATSAVPTNPEEDALLDQLRGVLADRPEDIEGRQLLAAAHTRRGEYAEAAAVLGEIADILGPRATGAIFADRAEAMIQAAGGYVSPEAEQNIARAIQLSPEHPGARYYAGLALAQRGDLDRAISVWDRLQRDSAPDAPWLASLNQMLADARVARGSGPFAPGAGVPGPTAADLAAAETLSPEERDEMVLGMVTRLETRLTEENGEPEDWLRLISARVQLGQMDEARRAYALSQQRLEGSAASFIREQALVLGVIEQ